MYLGTEGCHSVDWVPVAQRGEKRGTAVNPIMNLGNLCTCYVFKKDQFCDVATNLNPLVRDSNPTQSLISMNIRSK